MPPAVVVLIDQATACTCAACRLIPQLDLKVISCGRFSRWRIAGAEEELTGPDVILAHRLLKNRVREDMSLGGYALQTEAV